MPTYVLYDPSEASHVDATTLITHDAVIYEGDYDNDGTEGDDPLGAVSNIFASGGVAGTSLGIGKADLGSSTSSNKFLWSLFRITLPEGPKTSPTGDLIGDANTSIKKINLKFRSHSISGSSANPNIAYFSPMVKPPSSIDYAAVTWKTMDGTTAWSANGAYSTGDRDTDSDYGTGTDGVLIKRALEINDWNQITLQDNSITGPSQFK